MYSTLSRPVPSDISRPGSFFIPAYICRCGSDECIVDSIQLGDTCGWVDTLGPCAHPHYYYVVCLGVSPHCHSCSFHDPDLQCNGLILFCLPTSLHLHYLHVYSIAATTCSIRDSNLHCCSCVYEWRLLDIFRPDLTMTGCVVLRSVADAPLFVVKPDVYLPSIQSLRALVALPEFSWLKNSRNFSITLIWGSVS